jgi:hypothetical protein
VFCICFVSAASVKRTQESLISGGGGEEKIYRRRTNSPGRQSVERSTSPSVSAQQKMVCSSFFMFFI